MTLTVQSDIVWFITLQVIQIFQITTIQWKEWISKLTKTWKNLTKWQNANEICLNVSKTEDASYKSSRKLSDVPLKVKFDGKRLCPTNSVKYFRINIDENLNWKQHISDIAINLNKTNGILSKLRHFIDRKTIFIIFIIPYLFGHKIQIQLKDYLFCKRNSYQLYIS